MFSSFAMDTVWRYVTKVFTRQTASEPGREFIFVINVMTTMMANHCNKNIPALTPSLPQLTHLGGNFPLIDGCAYPGRQFAQSVPVKPLLLATRQVLSTPPRQASGFGHSVNDVVSRLVL